MYIYETIGEKGFFNYYKKKSFESEKMNDKN